MVGRELSAVFPKTFVEPGDVVLELRGLGCRVTGVRDVSLQVRARRDSRDCRPGRRGPNRAGSNALRSDAGRLWRGGFTRSRRQDRFPFTRRRAWDRLRSRGSPPPRRDPRDAGRGQHHTGHSACRLPVRLSRLAPRASHGRPVRRPARNQDRLALFPRGQPIGRQPAESRARPLAGGGPSSPDSRRADPGRGCRRQGRDPSPHERAGRPWPRHLDDLVRAARSSRYERSDRRDARRRDRRCARKARSHPGGDPRAGARTRRDVGALS